MQAARQVVVVITGAHHPAARLGFVFRNPSLDPAAHFLNGIRSGQRDIVQGIGDLAQVAVAIDKRRRQSAALQIHPQSLFVGQLFGLGQLAAINDFAPANQQRLGVKRLRHGDDGAAVKQRIIQNPFTPFPLGREPPAPATQGNGRCP